MGGEKETYLAVLAIPIEQDVRRHPECIDQGVVALDRFL